LGRKVRNLITILFVVFLATSCHRKAIPDSTYQYTTSIVQKDSVIVRDTTINIPSKEVSLEFSLDSLISAQKRLQKGNVDSSYKVMKVSQKQYKDTSLKATLYMNSSGWLIFSCKEDSLKEVISNLTVAYAQLYVTKQQTKIVPGPVQIQTHIPAWMWWWFGITLIYIIFKIGLFNFTPVTGVTSIIKFIFSNFKK